MKKFIFLLTVVLVLAVSCTATTIPLAEESDYKAVSEVESKVESKVVNENSVVQDEVIVSESEIEEVKTHYEYGGYGLDVVLGEGSGYITYPTVLTSEDIVSFLSYIKSEYPSYLDGITYSLDGNKINLTYPKSFGGAEAAIAQQLFLNAFDSYIKKISASVPVVEGQQPVVVSTPVAEVTKTTEEKASVVNVPVVENIAAERSNTPVIILLIVIALIVLAAVYYFFIFKRKEVN